MLAAHTATGCIEMRTFYRSSLFPRSLDRSPEAGPLEARPGLLGTLLRLMNTTHSIHSRDTAGEFLWAVCSGDGECGDCGVVLTIQLASCVMRLATATPQDCCTAKGCLGLRRPEWSSCQMSSRGLYLLARLLRLPTLRLRQRVTRTTAPHRSARTSDDTPRRPGTRSTRSRRAIHMSGTQSPASKRHRKTPARHLTA